MSASLRSAAAALGLAALAAAGCHTPVGLPAGSAFAPDVHPAPREPDAADDTAAEIARAALVSNSEETAGALRRLRAIETVLKAADEPSTGLMPFALDLRNASLDDRRAYTSATRELLARKDLDPAHRAELELFVSDDPLVLAGDRLRDAWLLEFGRAFNALAEPLGQSIMTTSLAPYRVAQSLLNYALVIYQEEALSLQRRQALAHWKEYLERNPGAPEAEALRPRIQEAQARWLRTQRDRAVHVAEKALDVGEVRLALVYADRALRYQPEDRRASELRSEAATRLLEIRDLERRSVAAAPGGGPLEHAEEQRRLAHALLLPRGDVDAAARSLEDADPHGSLVDEARFARALAAGDAGDDDAMWRRLEALAGASPERSNMARHAAALLGDPQVATYRAFRSARSGSRWARVRWVLLGPFYQGLPDRGLPRPLEWMVDVPQLAQAVAGTPMRLINVPWEKPLPAAQQAAVAARRHLRRHPTGAHSAEVRDWLEAYESQRGNWVAAYSAAEGRPDADLRHVAELREKAASQALEAALQEKTVDLRVGMCRQVGISYPGTRAARAAGEVAHTEVREATPERIRIARSFLEENPKLAGPEGLGMRPELLDGDPANGELHPQGITLLGGRAVEVDYLAESGSAKDPPRVRREAISDERLARVVSLLEETSYRKMLLDPLADVEPDARRDLYFEKVRLGLAGEPDPRPAAASTYAYRGVGEKYGIVRTPESFLPFDIVIQGSIDSMSLGAFPRIRPPKETPDAILYR